MVDDPEEESSECPQERLVTVRQTSPVMSEGEIYVEEMLDLEANAVFRPILQAILWLSELIATTRLRKEKVTKRGLRCDQPRTTRAMHDIVARAQVVLDQESTDMVAVLIVMTRILILVVSLVVKLGCSISP